MRFLAVLRRRPQQPDFPGGFAADNGIGEAGGNVGPFLVDRRAAAHDFRVVLRQAGIFVRFGVTRRVDRLQDGGIVSVAGPESGQQ